MRLNRWWPLLVMAAGVGIFMFGFLYDVLYAGIPYPDPTPELAAKYAWHSRIAGNFYLLGVATVGLGTIAGIVRVVVRRRCGAARRR
jgi:hypothetical protein